MIICKDCKFFKKSIISPDKQSRCNAPQNYKFNIVTGKRINEGLKFCDINRDYDHLCGPGAKWFVKKEKSKWPGLLKKFFSNFCFVVFIIVCVFFEAALLYHALKIFAVITK